MWIPRRDHAWPHANCGHPRVDVDAQNSRREDPHMRVATIINTPTTGFVATHGRPSSQCVVAKRGHLWTPTTILAWPRLDACVHPGIASCGHHGHPLETDRGHPRLQLGSHDPYMWATSHTQWTPTYAMWTPSYTCGQPRATVDTHTHSWVSTPSTGHPRIGVGDHRQTWASTLMGGPPHIWVDCHALRWTPTAKLG